MKMKKHVEYFDKEAPTNQTVVDLFLDDLRVVTTQLYQVYPLVYLVQDALDVGQLRLKVYRSLELVELTHHLRVVFL